MTHPIANLTDEELGQRLGALTRAAEAPASLWRGAAPPTPKRCLLPTLGRKVPDRWAALAASLLLVIGLAAVTLPNLGKARSSSVSPSRLSPSLSNFRGLAQGQAGFDLATPQPNEPPPAADDAPQDLPRQVIRKATIELTTPDVRAAMLKATMLLNLATGEFTENSSLTGEGPTAHATLTLRIAAGRLSEALNSLRALGTVTSEQTTGDDVTDQAVDIGARLRNEQRVETELLDLLASRKDAPLDDILAVRTQLANIRESIERLTAQRDRLSHLVSLATILIVIRADTAPPPTPAAAAIWDYFRASIAGAWHSGLSTLADTAAALVRIAIGGLIWWLLILAILATALHFHRRSRSAAATEPAPAE